MEVLIACNNLKVCGNISVIIIGLFLKHFYIFSFTEKAELQIFLV
jgi:hypothetical protein